MRSILGVQITFSEAVGDKVEYARAVSDYHNQYDDKSLSFKVGDIVAVRYMITLEIVVNITSDEKCVYLEESTLFSLTSLIKRYIKFCKFCEFISLLITLGRNFENHARVKKVHFRIPLPKCRFQL